MVDIRLYDYQEEMRRRIWAAFRSHRSVMVQMPTGTGKTYLLASCVYGWMERHEGEVWIVAHRRELVEQIRETVGRLMGIDVSGAGRPLSRLRVVSIQWLARHYMELEGKPSLIVVDEAHHAVAKTYAEVMNAFPKAKKLGVTATPCRMTRRGFTDLFDVLLQSWPVNRFIAAGRLSLYDYMSVRADSEDQRRVLSLTRRGADGDFSLKEMSEKLDVRPSIERLCDTVLRYAGGKKGIVYAIDIAHAEHIAECYREHGLEAVAISSRTPPDERRDIIGRFRATAPLGCGSVLRRPETSATDIQVLVNVDLFGEGFDCPDVEFIQLARPTLSLAKYLQQVGRGMRVHDGKKYCLILDNVGLYRLFGLPSDDRDWQAMFDGGTAGKGDIRQAEERYEAACSVRSEAVPVTSDSRTELVTVMTHEGQRADLAAAYGYEVVRNGDGMSGVADKDGMEVLPCIYNKVELKSYGMARLSGRRKIDRKRPWIDLRNGVRFVRCPRIERRGFLEFSTPDGQRFYPRVWTRLMDENSFVALDALEHGIEGGLRFLNFYIQPSEPTWLYSFKDKIDDTVLWENEHGGLAWRNGLEGQLHPTTADEWAGRKAAWKADVARFKTDEKECIRLFKPKVKINDIGGRTRLNDYQEPVYLRIARNAVDALQVYYRRHFLDKWESVGTYLRVFPQAYGIRVVQAKDEKYLVRTELFRPLETPEVRYDFAELQDNAILHLRDNGNDYWVYLENGVCFTRVPEFVTIGFVGFLKVGSVYMERCQYSRETYRRSEIRSGNGICFIGSREVAVKTKHGLRRFYIHRRYADGKRFVVSESLVSSQYDTLYELYYDGTNAPVIRKKENK